MPFEHLQAAQTSADSVTGCVPVAWVSAILASLVGALTYQTRRLTKLDDLLIERRKKEEDDARTESRRSKRDAG